MLVITNCVFGQLTCAARKADDGAMLFLQPCTTDRAPTERARWVGPIATAKDARTTSDWIARGRWDVGQLPARLHAEANVSVPASQN